MEEPVAVVDVTRGNFAEVFPAVLQAVNAATYVAIDTEFSGLGNDRELQAPHISTRYNALRRLTSSHALLQLGLACFRVTAEEFTEPAAGKPQEEKNRLECEVTTFAFHCLPNYEFTVTPSSVKFLVENGFDLGKLFTEGIPFKPASGVKKKGKGAAATESAAAAGTEAAPPPNTPSLATIIRIISERRIPITFHNGLLDSMFIYHAFIAPLPDILPDFQGALARAFPHILDTKYVAEFEVKEKASFLQYLFHRYNRKIKRQTTPALRVTHSSVHQKAFSTSSAAAGTSGRGRKRKHGETVDVCENYARHGHCRVPDCTRSHDVQDVLDAEEARQRKKAKPNADAPPPTNRFAALASEEGEDAAEAAPTAEATSTAAADVESTVSGDAAIDTPACVCVCTCRAKAGALAAAPAHHSAGYDAVSTGVVYANYLLRYGPAKFAAMQNNLYVIGSNRPLLIAASQFSPAVAPLDAAETSMAL